MENSLGNSHGAEIPKKSRSLDLKSLYKSGDLKDSSKNKSLKSKGSPQGDEDKRNGNNNKRKKSRKALPLSSFSAVNSSSKSLTEVYNGGTSLGLHDSKNLKELGLSQKLENGCCDNGISLSLGDGSTKIPRRKRGFVGRNKFEGGQGLKLAGGSSTIVGVNDGMRLTSEDSGIQNENSKGKQKNFIDDNKESRNSESGSVQHLKEEDGITGFTAVNDGDSLLKKSRKNSRKRKDSPKGGKSVAKKVGSLVGSSVKPCNDLKEDDEENLEENAARMLSSRFDPSCTGFSSNSKVSASPSENGFSSNSKVSASPSENGFSFLLSSGQDANSGSKMLSGSESTSVDASDRVLRPRRSRKQKGSLRKRRHFYEIYTGDLDAYWVVNRKIKVFWPLDQSWYYGLVKEYDEEKKLHHVKYDDRDEEWIDLQNERFKLLLFSSEVPNKSLRKRSRHDRGSDDNIRKLKLNREKKRNVMADDDNGNASYMDSEPIISWLARTNHRVKSSPLHAVKRQKSSASSLSSSAQPLLCDEAVDDNGFLHGSSLKGDKTLLDGLVDDASLGSTSCPKDNNHPIVYFRRRYRRTEKTFTQASEGNCIVDEFQDLGELEFCLERLDPEADLLFSDNAGKLQLKTSLLHSKSFRLALSFPLPTASCDFFGEKSFWVVRAMLLLQCGTMMTLWPMVHLEILFVDNEVGLRFLLFEGSLRQAVAFVFQVLMIFYRHSDEGKFADLHLPVTSVRFKFSCSQDFRKQFVFAFYNFHEVKHSKWVSLDSKLKRHCVLNRQLPLSECTYDNIKALQNGSNQLLTSGCRNLSPHEGLRGRKYRQGISLMGASRESSFLNVGQYCSNYEKKQRNLPLFSLSFGAAPTFFLSLHLKLLMEHSVTRISFQDHDSVDQPGSSGNMVVEDSFNNEGHMNKSFGSNVEKTPKASSKDSASDIDLTTVDRSVCSDGLHRKSLHEYENEQIFCGTSAVFHEPEEVGAMAIIPSQDQQREHSEVQQLVSSSKSPDGGDKNVGCNSVLSGIRVEIPPFDQYEKHVDGEVPIAQQSTDLTWNMNGGIIPSPNPTAPRSMGHRNRNSSLPIGHAHGWSDGKADFFHNNFGNGPKKPRTQVSYSMPFGGLDYSSKHKSHHQRSLPHKRIRRASEKRSSDVTRGSQKNLELSSCDVNILITLGDRGWRECGAQVSLELFDHNEWKLAVKVSGSTRYSYKAHQFLQPGSTNRYTHAMMWKGGKDWILEFIDRSQWALFKEMHEECYNRNIRAASVKNIPIPGVHLIEEYDDNATEVTFFRSSSKYLRQVETDVDMALDPEHVLYDMDSDDEQWISRIRKTSESDVSSSSLEISDENFEKTMDTLEKAAYTQQCDQFNSDEIQELTAGIGSMKVIRPIYEHWRQKRQRIGMPLIRHLQPPLWERYQQQVREWELAMSKVNPILPSGSSDKAPPIEKPPMFAFCLKPRGLEVPNKGSKQRSQRRISVSGQSHHALGDHEGCHSFGRRSNGFLFGDERVLYPVHNYESLEDSPLSQASPRLFSPRDVGGAGYFSMCNDGFDQNHHQKLQKSKSKKFGTFLPSNDSQMMASYGQRPVVKRNGIHRWNTGISELPSRGHYISDSFQRHGPEQFDNYDLDEYRMRDAASAAKHALNMAKFKRERAQRLLFRADLAIHKAMVALMTAEAIKESSENLNGDG